MQKFGDISETQRRRSLCIAKFVAITSMVFCMSNPMQNQAQSQAQSSASIPFKFEVASITLSDPDASGGFMTIPGPGSISDRFTERNVTLLKLIRAAHGIPMDAEDSRISGGPAWLSSARYDIDAKIDSSMVDELKKLSPDESTLAQQHMLQELLADRFKLTVHRETKNLPIYTLGITKNGSKLQEAKPGEIASSSYSGPGRTQSITGQARSIASLVRMLSVTLGCPVLDKTGLPGKYDFKLEWTPDNGQIPSGSKPDDGTSPQPGSNAFSIFTAIQEQLGLKLVSGKGPVDILVIDHVERPSAN